MARLLVTRPKEQADTLAERLRAAGHTVIVDPMLGIRFLDVELPPLDGVQAILLTSRNGARALARATTRRDIGILAVGDATAEAARAEGFGIVQSAEGDAEDLVVLASRMLSPAAGRVVHVSGHDIAEDVAAALAARGFEAARIVAYEAETASSLSPEAQTALREGELDAVLLHSPRAAKTFAALLEADGLADRLDRVEALALSEQVAAMVRHLSWRGVRVAAKPNEDALLELLDADPEPVPVSEPPPAAAPAPPLPQPQPPQRKSAGGFMPGLLAGLLAGAAAGAAVAWYLIPTASPLPPGMADRLAKLEQAASAPRPAPAAPVDLKPLEARVTAVESRPAVDLSRIEERLTAAENRAPSPGGEAAATGPDLTPRLEATEKQLSAIADRLKAEAPREGEAARIALVLAVAELAETVSSGAPFADPLRSVESLLGAGKAAAQPLAAMAAQGVPTVSSLQERFPAVARTIMTAAAAGDGEGWIDHVRARLTSAVTIRRTGDVPGDTPEALVARAEAKLRQNDAAGAAAELGRLTGKPAEAAADWLAAAKMRSDGEAALAVLKRRAVETAGEGRR